MAFFKQHRGIKIFITILILFLVSLVGIFSFSSFKEKTIREFIQIQKRQNENTIFYDINGEPFHIIRGLEDRRYIPLSQTSSNLQKAVLAIEDTRFFQHLGFDPIRIIGAIFHLIKQRTYAQGASTITQQLVKLTLLTPERTISRKIKEIFMAIALEQEFSKSKILEFYLNKVYLGHRNYGIENAAINYFGKNAKHLNLAESALIAGLIKKPEGYSPFTNLKKARKRQLLVLKRMATLGWISIKDYREAVNYQINIQKSRITDLQKAPYFTNHILLQLKKKYGSNKVYGGGLRVFTTLDRKLQNKLEKTVQKRIRRRRSFDQIAALSIDPKTGFVKALIGGVDFKKSEFNRATQAQRQPGSSFKPFLYSAALLAGIKPNDVFIDEKTQYTREINNQLEIYSPENFSGEYKGSITMAHALRLSNNVVSVKILKKIGIRRLQRTAKKFGISIPAQNGLCLALGCGETTLLQLVSGYSVFANEGKKADPVFILKVTDSKGNILEEYIPYKIPQVLSKNQNFQMVRMLQDVVTYGTGKNAKIARVSGGKTGTSDDHRDAWFVGFTSTLVTGFWIGNDDNRSMRYEQGGGTPALLWKKFMKSIPQPPIQKGFVTNHKFEDFKVCVNSGLRAGPWCKTTAWYPFLKGTAPEKYCDLHPGPQFEFKVCKISGQLATRYCPPTTIETKKFFENQEPTLFCLIHGKDTHKHLKKNNLPQQTIIRPQKQELQN
ncbi:MAG: penicillin-binding protein 1A [bacterium]|jgi:penicillin-binding protein 1A